MDSEDHIGLYHQYGAQNYAPLPVVLAEAAGAWVWDIEGNKYLDMLSGYSALNFGHRNARFLAAANKQLHRMGLSCRAFHHDQLGPFCRDLANLCGMQRVLPMNSGAEAVETAIKAARKWGYEKKKIATDKAEIICFSNNFHGRTTTIISFSTVSTYQAGFGAFTPGFKIAPFGDLEAVKRLVTENTVAVLVEPIQGEGGIIVPPAGFLPGLRKLCTEARVLFMADEIQTGLCRTGEVFACTHDKVVPDLYILGKALGGGIIPISAVVGSDEVMSVFTPGTHGSTFGGNALACAVASEVIAYINEEHPEQAAAELGNFFMQALRELKCPAFKEVRGRGLMIGVDIHEQFGSAKDYCKKLLKYGILAYDTRKQTVRFLPPLMVTKEELKGALKSIAEVFGA
jgi:ornithine--oxo-acid transaminase